MNEEGYITKTILNANNFFESEAFKASKIGKICKPFLKQCIMSFISGASKLNDINDIAYNIKVAFDRPGDRENAMKKFIDTYEALTTSVPIDEVEATGMIDLPD